LESLTNLVYLGQQTFSFAQKHLTARVTFSCHARKYSEAIYMLAKQQRMWNFQPKGRSILSLWTPVGVVRFD